MKESKENFSEEKLIKISAHSQEALLEILEKKDFSEETFTKNNGDYRLVLFDPTDERLDKAKRLISKGKPWKGRQDIWYSNKPLLKENAKISFLFPGFEPSANPEIASISEYFNITIPQKDIEGNQLLNHAFTLYYSERAIDQMLKNLGIVPDLNAGHSLGEWFAAKAGGLITEESVENLLISMDPEKYKIEDVFFIAVGCGLKRLGHLLDEIPELYLSNDNCTNQILFCGTGAAKDALIEVLKKEKIFYQVLTFQSGFHSPFLRAKLDLFEEGIKKIEIQKEEIPVWSATTLTCYPSNYDDFKALTLRHLLETVRFRELTEKLYFEENVKVFIQIGSGSLVGFIDDTLKNEEYSAISTSVTVRSTLEQFRRVLALLYIEGKEDINSPLLRNFFQKSEVVIKQKDEQVLHVVQNSKIELKEKTFQQEDFSIEPFMIKSAHPVIQALNDNVKTIFATQQEILGLLGQSNSKRVHHSNGNYERAVTAKISEEKQLGIQEKNIGKTFEELLHITLKDHPYLIDHSLTKQPKDWPIVDDLNTVIPMTMTFELLMEAAHKQDLSKKILRLGPVSVFQWMGVGEDRPFIQKLTGSWKTLEVLSVGIKNFATAEVKLGDTFPVPPEEYCGTIELGKSIMESPTPKEIYENHMFHGPLYQGIIEIKEVTDKGMRGVIKKAGGKGSLLDNIGQMYGLYLQLTLSSESVSFPVKVDEINFYQDVYDQEGIFECICVQTSLTNEFSIGDIVIKRDGKIWCVAKGWKNRRFAGFDKHLWNLIMSPSKYILAKEIAPDVYFYDNAYDKAVNWDFISRTYLTQEEKSHYNSLQLNKRKDYLISRVALKDSSRKYLQKKFNKYFFPIEFSSKYNENRKPSITGRMEEINGLEISLAHKGTNSVSIISNKPVGIDIEIIEERSEGFMGLTLTKKERELLQGKNQEEWVTRFWVAKEAYGKMMGVGLQGNPKQYQVNSINGEDLVINKTTIKTIIYNNKFIIGWTQ